MEKFELDRVYFSDLLSDDQFDLHRLINLTFKMNYIERYQSMKDFEDQEDKVKKEFLEFMEKTFDEIIKMDMQELYEKEKVSVTLAIPKISETTVEEGKAGFYRVK